MLCVVYCSANLRSSRLYKGTCNKIYQQQTSLLASSTAVSKPLWCNQFLPRHKTFISQQPEAAWPHEKVRGKLAAAIAIDVYLLSSLHVFSTGVPEAWIDQQSCRLRGGCTRRGGRSTYRVTRLIASMMPMIGPTSVADLCSARRGVFVDLAGCIAVVVQQRHYRAGNGDD